MAVIDVGASAIRLVIAQHAPGERPQVLEEASRSVLLGRDTFAVGRIGAATTDAAVRALSGFRRMMDDYGVTRVRAVATSAVREAANCDTFLDRMRVRTGVEIEVIDGSEESRLTYLAVRDGLGAHAALAAPATLLVEVGGGSVDVTRLENGQPVQAGVFPLGAIRLRQRLGVWFGSHEQRIRLLTAQVDTTVGEIVTEVPVERRRVRRRARQRDALCRGASGRRRRRHRCRDRDAWRSWNSRRNVAKCDEDELVNRYRLSPIEAETLVPALLVYRALIDATAAQTIVVPEVSLRAGLLVDLVGGSAAEADFAPQVLASAMTLGDALPLGRRSRQTRGAPGDPTVRQSRRRARARARAIACCSRSPRCCTTSACSSACAATTSTACICCRRRRSSA